jgi:proton-translocating NAD(P)+ transhydrogenase subunit alpha
MKILISSDRTAGEARVAMIPVVAKKLIGDGAEVLVEGGAGAAAHFTDEAYEAAGASLVAADDAAVWSEADVVLTLNAPPTEAVGRMKHGALLIGSLAPLAHPDLMQQCAEKQVTAIATEFIPRISRAQAMDTLSSQANIGGYKAVLIAANHCAKLFPMMITAAGTLSPAKVLIIGVGVAGLQAIATARRLGAVVEAYDVRPATKEQVQSLGARFVELPLQTEDAETAGGYAKEQSAEQQRQQTELMTKHILAADVVVTTAAIFGKAPPLLIPADVVAKMPSGSVIVDLAASPEHDRGNCELTKPGEVITTERGVTIVGTLNLPAHVPTHASQAFANNMYNLLKDLMDEGAIKIDLEDDIQKGAVVTHQGQIRIEG